jgi:hypothetical protein
MLHFGSDSIGSFPPYLTGLEWVSSLEKKTLLSLFTDLEDERAQDFIPRSQDLSYNYNLVFSGCSETTGDYLTSTPDKYDGKDIWGSLVSKHFKVPALSFGLGAASVYEINKRLMSRFRKHGNPKVLLCLYPDLARLNIPNDPEILVDSRFAGNDTSIYRQTSTQIRSNKPKPIYSKKPHLKEDVIPEIVPMWLNLQSILTLEQYCTSNNITFLYSTWSPQAEDIISSLNSMSLEHYGIKAYPGYLAGGVLDLKKGEECPIVEHNLETMTSSKYYKFGIDGKHMGTHRHMHFADLFIEKLGSQPNFQFTV